jgi:hypothetical protein
MAYVYLRCTTPDCGEGRSIRGSKRYIRRGMARLGWTYGPDGGARCASHHVGAAVATKTRRPYLMLAAIVVLAAILLYLGSR